MPGRLTDHISELIGADQLERLSSILQTTPASAATALRTALDGTMKGLAEVATPAGGTTRLGAMLEQEGITALDRLDEVLGRGEDADGTRLAADILGPRVDDAADSVSLAASLDSRDAGLLTLGFAAPLAVSTLARRQRDETLTAAAIGALLIAERDETAAALIAGREAASPPTAEAQLAAKALDATREDVRLVVAGDDEVNSRHLVMPPRQGLVSLVVRGVSRGAVESRDLRSVVGCAATCVSQPVVRSSAPIRTVGYPSLRVMTAAAAWNDDRMS